VNLATDRLILRQWEAGDLEPFARMNADPEVMRYFLTTLDRRASDDFARVIEAGIAERGWGLWAVEVVGVAPFIGFVGLHPVAPDLAGGEIVEIGWRLDRPYWGRGYATEAGRVVLAHAFARLGLAELVSFTSAINHRSLAVMRRLGLTHRPERDFLHPRIPAGHPLRPHVVYATST